MPGIFTAENAGATVSWNKVELPEGVLDGTPEYGYRVYAYKASGNSLFSETDVAPGETSVFVPLDASKYTGAYYFMVSVLTSTGGLGDKTAKSQNITPLADITAPEGIAIAADNSSTALSECRTSALSPPAQAALSLGRMLFPSIAVNVGTSPYTVSASPVYAP